jgi:starvation-inducible DNA-binding protein
MYDTRVDLSITVREKLAPLIQARVADGIDLLTQIKYAHWNVKGPHFLTLRQLFGRLAAIVAEQVDLLAERLVALGGLVCGTARMVASQSSLAEFQLDASGGMEMAAAVADKLAAFGRAVRANIVDAAKLGDSNTADLFTEVSREIDRQLWLVEAHLQAGC